MNRLLLALLVVPLVTLWGCNERNNKVPAVMKPATLLIEPIVKQYSDPEVRIAEYSTFAVLPLSVAVGVSAEPSFGNELLEKQMLYALRNHLECLGYEFLPDPSKADFVATIDGANEYKMSYIPPSLVTVPSYVPGRTVSTYSRESGNATVYGTYGSVYGNYSGSTNTTTYIPGYWTTTTQSVPGRTSGDYYPSLAITVFDCKTGRRIWYGTAVGCSKNPDIRVSSQLLVWQLFEKMSMCEKALDRIPVGRGVLDIKLVPFSPDGDSVYPMINDINTGTPSALAGLKLGDIILSIDGTVTANKPYSEVLMMTTGDVGSECVLSIARDKKVFEVRLKRVART